MDPNKISIVAWAIPMLLLVALCVQAIPKPAEEIETELEEPEAQATEISSSQSVVEPESEVTQVAKPKFVCNPKCAGYAEEYQTNLYPTEYERFKKRVCGKVGKCD